MRAGTMIPKSFELAVGVRKFWVHPNATKHMAEFLTNGAMRSSAMSSQGMLTSFHAAVQAAMNSGIQYGKMMNVGGWELIFSAARSGHAFPVIKHALMR